MQGIGPTRVRRLVPAAVAAVAVVAVVAGCGGGGSSTSSSGGSGGSFVSTAEAACTSANKQIAALGTPQQAEVHQYMQSTEAVLEKLHKEVSAAVGSGAAEEKYVKTLGESVVVVNEMSNAALSENFDAVRELSDRLIEFHLGELAEAAGLTACAEVPGRSS